jgi:putative glutamine amidotransferase
MTAPVIAVAGYHKPISVAPGVKEPGLVAPRRYLDGVRLGGGAPVVVTAPAPFAQGVLLLGGGDLDPSTYGAHREPETDGLDPERDAGDIALARDAIVRDMPVLAICRGAQVLNVALGGTLVQHVEGHREAPGRGLETTVTAASGSRIACACGEHFPAWCSHHQVIDRLGDGLRATAWAADGTIEGAERDGAWVVAVQWHPERTVPDDERQVSLFRAFVEACRAWRPSASV